MTSPAAVLAGEARWCVVCADCREVLPTLPERCVDHVITDPPYDEHTHAKSRAGACSATACVVEC
jgi:DNA modification methylase